MARPLRIVFLFLIAFSVLASQKNFAQQKEQKSLKIWAEKHNQNCSMGTIAETIVNIQNISDKPVEIKVRRGKSDFSRNQESFFRLDGKTTPARLSESANTIVLQPNEISKKFVAYFSTGFKKGDCNVNYQFFNTLSKDDFAEIDLPYKISDQIPEDKLYVNEQISISFMFPNPAVRFGEFEYRMPNSAKSKVKISIHNVLGKKMGSYDLEPKEFAVRIPFEDFDSGVYFYMLVLDDETVATKKFVLKK